MLMFWHVAGRGSSPPHPLAASRASGSGPSRPSRARGRPRSKFILDLLALIRDNNILLFILEILAQIWWMSRVF